MDKMKYCVANEKISSIGNIFDDSIQNADGGDDDDGGGDDRLNHQPSSSSQPIIIRCESNDRQTETNSFQKIDSPFAYASASCLIENSKGTRNDKQSNLSPHNDPVIAMKARHHSSHSIVIRRSTDSFENDFDPNYFEEANVTDNSGLCAFILTLISVILIICTLPFSMFLCIKVVQEYERAVIFRLGRLVRGGARGPGIFFIIPCIDSYCKVDLRTVSFDVPPQEILSRDSVTVSVDAVVYFRISNATVAVSNVEDYGRSTRLLAATTLRNVLGTKDLSQILSERESISHVMQSSLDEATDPWGVKVERVEIKDVRLPVQLQRAMAAEAEAAREARAKVIAAEGEQRASKALKEAAEVMSFNPAALQLRYLQTLNSIAAEKNSTIVFPVRFGLKI
ncbi:Mechanosensory protein 2 [Sarcoptes scabiei]|uniref:Mechanosensory protein 2 n=2 Tax=Sarcoptes scabiei TaxID=52283 RepID=A0A834R7I6_SARSC|nr:Mechanosensory protein 2 [Sarcoptes scabiei]